MTASSPVFSLDFPVASVHERHSALFRHQPEDFFVEEILGFEPDEQGEHLWIYLEKTGLNTHDVARMISEKSGLKIRDIGYSGMKDKKAVTRQWFSIKSNKDFNFDGLQGVQLLDQRRNSRKLKRGMHRENCFRIRLREMLTDKNMESVAKGAVTIKQQGVPNYFGLQRFGKEGANLEKSAALFDGKMRNCPRFQRSIYLSAARAYLFNSVLGKRVEAGNWNSFLEGDMMSLNGTSSVFKAEVGDEAIAGRLSDGDIHPTGPLWGAGKLETEGQVRLLESDVADTHELLARGLEHEGLKQERRALRVQPMDFSYSPDGEDALVLEFRLPRGSYATSVLRELVKAPGL